ncbi:hypothetical protein HS1genome_1803 [Sulfodiicoccus acidiphilus]|uniref:Glycosyltransferase subfamily 4-like N-terminal domain-containing protein n=1 Tax=Sulfodiicoccus acidiphilus TaxID=1670455 RepID=A0A348B5G2_9CREN|nr:hypothetical protein [Sulfodiicoccus acidiphilus]BBD73414.1 hypothetical protein HS1genome_1803 [Sulfodiicoccus acidiphilus]
MRLGIVYERFMAPGFGGGGAVHSVEVTKRLAKWFDVVYVPPSPVFRRTREELLNAAKRVEALGIPVVEDFYSILDGKRTREANDPRGLSKLYNFKVDFLYEPDHTSWDIFFLKEKSRRGIGVTFHEPPYYADSLNYLRRLIKFLWVNPRTGKGFHTRFLYNELVAKRKGRGILGRNPPELLAAVSEGTLEMSRLRGEVLRPGNAFDSSLSSLRGRGRRTTSCSTRGSTGTRGSTRSRR